MYLVNKVARKNDFFRRNFYLLLDLIRVIDLTKTDFLKKFQNDV